MDLPIGGYPFSQHAAVDVFAGLFFLPFHHHTINHYIKKLVVMGMANKRFVQVHGYCPLF
jgi:hypothetical protein